MTEKTCLACGTKFDGRRNYCSRECYQKNYNKRIEKRLREHYNSGIVYTLSMEDWKWHRKQFKQKEGEQND